MKRWIALLFVCVILTSCGAEKTLPEIIETKQENDDGKYYSSAEQEESESETELLERFEYEYDENNRVIIGVFKDEKNEKYKLYYSGYYQKENIGIVQDDFLILNSYSVLNECDLFFNAHIGEDFVNYICADGEVTMNEIPMNPLENVPEEYIVQFEEMREERNKIFEKLFTIP